MASVSLLYAVLFVLLSVLFVMAVFRLWRRRAAARQVCRWRRDPEATSRLTAWVCESCGEQAFSGDGEPPMECKKVLRAVV